MRKGCSPFLALIAMGCTTTGGFDAKDIPEEKPMFTMSLQELQRTDKAVIKQLNKDFPVTGFFYPYNPTSGKAADRNIPVYRVRCSRSAVKEAVEDLTRRGKKHGNRLGSYNTMYQAYFTLGNAADLYESAQKKCGYNYKNAIRQLRASASQALETAEMLYRSKRDARRRGLNNAVGLLTGAAAIAGAVSSGRSSGSGYRGTYSSDCPPSHEVCR